jgi:hypothetical protein
MPSKRGPLTIERVIERMRTIEAELPERDGVACFNRMYLRVTEQVLEAVEGRKFRNRVFLERLDVIFAGLYLDAYSQGERDADRAPKPWVPLFESRGRGDVAPIQFALAGMNAHINHDLPIALVQTAGELGIRLRRPSAEWADFEDVNEILERTEDEVKRWFATGVLGELDRAFGRVDDVIAMWSVSRAREHAWIAADMLEEVRGSPTLRDGWLTALGRMVGFAGRGLLCPTAPS